MKPANMLNKIFKRLVTWLVPVKVISQKLQAEQKQKEDCFLSWQTNLMNFGYFSDPSPLPIPKGHTKHILVLPQGLWVCYYCFLKCSYPQHPNILPLHPPSYGFFPGLTQISAQMSLIQKGLPWSAYLKHYYPPSVSLSPYPGLFFFYHLPLPEMIFLAYLFASHQYLAAHTRH